MKKIWIFSTYNWQGNPKALFLYMSKYFNKSHECWWISESKEQLDNIKRLGIENIVLQTDKQSSELIKNASVYITENFREQYPIELPTTTKIINTWHGVGLKHIELALGAESVLADSIVRKHIKNLKIYKNQSFFLATSDVMEEHFLQDTIIEKKQILKGGYPRNIVYKHDICTYDVKQIFNKNQFNQVFLFAPTYRIKKINGVLHELLPNFELLESELAKHNNLFIIKVHPFMKKDPHFDEMRKKYSQSPNILFWNDIFDIYEIFHLIDVAIIDYSSIFYDLLEANVSKFIRYIPDFNEYSSSLELIDDYFKLTGGEIYTSYLELLNSLSSNIPVIESRDYLIKHFFSYSEKISLDSLINQIDTLKSFNEDYPELHSFDIFDTLIRRKTLAPFSIFAFMQKKIINSNLKFSQNICDNWIKIRHKVEIDVRDMYRKTTFERQTDQVEVNLDIIYAHLQANYQLSQTQVKFLKKIEINAEINHVEPIQHRIDSLFNLKSLGHDVILISDMYLPENVIRSMLIKADPRLAQLPLFLSSTIGHQKSTGKLYKHIFFQSKYKYQKWVHYGDNALADGSAPRKFGIDARVHQMDSYIPFESKFIDSASSSFKYEAYQLSALMHRYRTNIITKQIDIQKLDFEKNYFSYAYAGSILVPYVHWTILDALKRGYETLYFISRDGHYLKMIADEIIKNKEYQICTKFIYGSRKAWRLPSFVDEVDEEMFGPFGNFVGMDTFQDLVSASYLAEAELLKFFPEFESLKHARHLRGETAENIRKTLSQSKIYREKVLTLAKEKRSLVKQYLIENIDFSEKFAFVEFWGRGYTQDVFSRLLADAANKPVLNPFYYIRSFSPESDINLRHNFVLAPVNFSYFEPIFASTPYQSISEYQLVDGKVEAVITPQLNEHYHFFEAGLINFTQDYLSLNIDDWESFARLLNEHSYTYQMKELDDQFICNVFGALKDNISSFGEVKEYAPILSVTQVETIRDKKDFDQLTSSIAISLARSDEKVRAYYQKIYKKMKLPMTNIGAVKQVYAINDFSQYIRADQFPIQVVSLYPNAIYSDIGFSKESKRNDIHLAAFEIFDVIAIEWLKNGIPRLVIKDGYVTANKDWVLTLKEAENTYIRKNEKGEYEPIEQRKLVIKATMPKITNAHRSANPIESTYTAIEKKNNTELVKIKWAKFTRDPHQFFADAKNQHLTVLKHCFDENTKVGKTLTRWIRRNL